MISFLNQFAFAQLLICALMLIPYKNKSSAIKLFVLLMLCGASYLLDTTSLQSLNSGVLDFIAFIGSNALPGVFWLVSLSIFADEYEISLKQYAIAALTLILPLLTQISLLSGVINSESTIEFISTMKTLGLVIEVSLILHGIYLAATNWRNDLVQDRRYFRGGIITLSGLYILLVILIGQILNIQTSLLALIEALALVVLTTGINLLLFKPKSSSIFASPIVDKTNVTLKPTSNPLLMALLDKMTACQLYREEGLTISKLAKQLATQDAKLRQLINKELGYRNFNDFLNHYRIKEVSQKLKCDPESELPILTLALESGFRSLSSFNKAFKQIHQITPTEFRKNHIKNINLK